MEENKTETGLPVTETEAPAAETPAEASAPAPSRELSPETLQAIVQAVAAYMQPAAESAPAGQEAPPAENPPAQPEAPKELSPEEKKAAEAAKKEELRRKRHKRRMRELRNLLIKTVLLLAVVYVLFFRIVGVTVMPNGDMYPRIDSGDLVLFYRLDKDVRAQDIIVFSKDSEALQQNMALREGNDSGPSLQLKIPTRESKFAAFMHSAAVKLGLMLPDERDLYICRVVATAGDTVEITDGGSLVVNGNYVSEPNIFSQTTAYLGFTEYPLTLKADECFVMADLRNGGVDSRFFGPVTTDEILGSVITIARRNNL